jgi:hypothetical protein
MRLRGRYLMAEGRLPIAAMRRPAGFYTGQRIVDAE